MIRTVIIEDELDARGHLKNLLTVYCPEVQIVGEAESVVSGINIIEKSEPQLILLDIHLPDGTGFDLLKHFTTVNFGIIFITAFSEFAVQAFKFSALHYVLKPIDPEDLILAIKKAGDEFNRQNLETGLKSLYFNIQNKSNKSKKVVLTTSSNWYVINSEDIILCKSERNYTEFCLTDSRNIVVSKTLGEYDDLLKDNGFFRAHKQYLINVNHIKSFDKSGAGVLYMTHDHAIPVSARKKEQLLNLFLNL